MRKFILILAATALLVALPRPVHSQAATKLQSTGMSAEEVAKQRKDAEINEAYGRIQAKESEPTTRIRYVPREESQTSQSTGMDEFWGSPTSNWISTMSYFSSNEDGSVTYRCNPIATDAPNSARFLNFKDNGLVLIYEVYEGSYRLGNLYQRYVNAYGNPSRSKIDEFGNTNYYWFLGNTRITLGPMDGNVMIDYEPIVPQKSKVVDSRCTWGQCTATDLNTGRQCTNCRRDKVPRCYLHEDAVSRW